MNRQTLTINDTNTSATVYVLIQYDKKDKRHLYGIYTDYKECTQADLELRACGYNTMIQENFVQFND